MDLFCRLEHCFVDDYPLNLGIQYNVTSTDPETIEQANQDLENEVKRRASILHLPFRVKRYYNLYITSVSARKNLLHEW